MSTGQEQTPSLKSESGNSSQSIICACVNQSDEGASGAVVVVFFFASFNILHTNMCNCIATIQIQNSFLS